MRYALALALALALPVRIVCNACIMFDSVIDAHMGARLVACDKVTLCSVTLYNTYSYK